MSIFTSPSDCDKRDGTVTIIADAPTGLEYGLDNGQMTIWQSSSNFINVPAGVYSVFIRNAGNTCVTPYALNNIQLEGPTAPVFSAVSITQPTDCGLDNGSINITATAGNTLLEYSIDGGINWYNTANFPNLKPDDYNVFIRNQGGTCVAAYSNNPISITYPEAVQIVEVQHSNPTDCELNDGRIEITAENGTTDLIYSVNGGSTWQESSVFANLSGGIYNVRVANSNESCLAIYPTLELVAPSGGSIDNVIATTGCDPEHRTISIVANSSTPLEYSIDGGATYQSSNNFINLAYGNYEIYIRNVNDACAIAYSNNPVAIEAPPNNNGQLIDHVQAADPTTCGASDGFIEVNASGVNLTYSIDGGISYGTQSTFENLASGKYWVFVKEEATGCEEDYIFNPVELVGVAPPTISDVSTTNLTDCNANNGTITITAAGDGFLQYSLDGSTWSNGNVFTNLLPGLYNVFTRYEDESCKTPYDNNPIIITAPKGPSIIDCIGNNPTDCEVNDGKLTVIAAGGNGSLKYSIDGGTVWQNSNEFTNLATGVYSVAVANADETCKAIHPICVLTAPTPPTINEIQAFDPTDCGKDNGAIIISAQGNGGVEYSIDEGLTWSTNSFFFNLPAGIYSIKVRNAQDNCELNYGAVTLNAPSQPTILAEITNQSTCTGSFIPVSVTMSEPIASYTIVGSGAHLNATVNGATLTFDAYLSSNIDNFLVYLDSEDGCTIEDDFVIFQTADPKADFILDNSICAGEEVTITFNGTASPAASLVWNPEGGTIISSSPATTTAPAAATIVVRWDTPGDETISLAIDDGGCRAQKTTALTVNKLPFASAGEDITICEGECLQLNGIGSGAQYQWTPAVGLSATNIPNPLACPPVTTTYQLLVMGADGCMAMDEVTVTVAGSLTANAGSDVAVCQGESVQLLASGGISYKWSPTIGLNNSNIANPVANPIATTTYTVTVTNANGCVGTDEVIVSVNPKPTVNAGTDKMICVGENAMLSATGGISYSWSPSTGLSNTLVPNPIASPSQTTTYTVTATDSNGCTNSDEVTVIVGGNANANAGQDVTICIGESTELAASGGVIYSWSPTTGLNNPNISHPITSPTSTITYRVTVTNLDGCIGTDEVTVTVNQGIAANAGADQSTCAWATVQLNASGGVSYSWSPTAGLSNPMIANPVFTPIATTTFTVTVTNAQGCTDTDQVTVFVNGNAPINAGADQTICQGGTAFLNASGGVSYAWSPSTGLSNPTIANPVANPNQTTTYTVTSTNAQGCTGTDQVTVFVNGNAPINAGSDQTICRGMRALLNTTGGVNYTWNPSIGLNNPNIANPIASPNQTTTYTVTSTNAQGCTGSDQVTIFINGACDSDGDGYSDAEEDANGNGIVDPGESDPNDPCDPDGATAIISPNQIICTGQQAFLNASGGISYTWSPSIGLSNPTIANPIATPSQTTTYCVTVTNTRGCTDVACVTVTIATPPTVVGCPDKYICRGGSTRLTVNGGQSWVWSPNTGLDNPFSPAPYAAPTTTTVYTVTGTDANGCTSTDEVIVFVEDNISIHAGNDQTICRGGTAFLNASGGLSYQWSPSTGLSNPTTSNPTANPSQTTIYTLTSTNAQGCTGTDQMTVFVTQGTEVVACEDKTICQGGSTPLNVTTGVAYTWTPAIGLNNPNSATPIANPNTTTTYTVFVTDANGCTGSDQVTVFVQNRLTITPSIIQPGCCNNNGSINLQVNGGSGNYSYNWTPNVSNSHTANGLSEGSYKVVITDNMGCDIVSNINLTRNCQCQTIAPTPEVCVSSTQAIGQICLPVNLNEINNYEIRANGSIIYPNHGCNFVNATAYSYALLPDLGNVGPYKIDSWIVNGLTYTGMVNSMAELANWMSTVDPTGNWSLNTTGLLIMGGNPNTQYANLSIIQQSSWISTILNPNTTGIAQHTLVEVPMNGLNSVLVTIKHLQTCCEETVLVKTCDTPRIAICEETIVDFEETTLAIATCDEMRQLCTTIPLLDIFNYTLEVNGNSYDAGFSGCNFDTTYAYSYYTIPSKGTNGPYKINSWVINGQVYNGEFTTLNSLVNLMNEWDTAGDWELVNSTLTIQGGLPANSYGRMNVEQINTGAVGIMELNTNLLPMGTMLSFSSGTNRVVITNKETNCIDQFTVVVNCEEAPKADCNDLFEETSATYSLENCKDKAAICINISSKDLGIYSIDQNGSFYTGEVGKCDPDTNAIQIFADAGKHTFIVTNELDGCSDELTVKVVCPSAIKDGLNVKDNNLLSSTISEVRQLKTKASANTSEIATLAESRANKSTSNIKVYSGFSPNRDGINDYFTIDGLEAYPNNELKIFNRFGQLFFEQQNYQNDWNGEVNGEILPNGTYFYILLDGKGKRYSGFIQINR